MVNEHVHRFIVDLPIQNGEFPYKSLFCPGSPMVFLNVYQRLPATQAVPSIPSASFCRDFRSADLALSSRFSKMRICLAMASHKVFTWSKRKRILHSHRIHVWYIYLQNWVIYGVNVGKYSSTMDPVGLYYMILT